jgi:large subunit ribosomal protein L25
MADLAIDALERTEFGKNASRRLRSEGRIPAVIYGQGRTSSSISVDPADVVEILYSGSGQNTIFTVKVADEHTQVLIRDYQLDPQRGDLMHVDFQVVEMGQVMEFEVPVEAVGMSKGVKEGGILDLVMREIQIECEAGEIPDQVTVEVSELEIGDSIRVSDLKLSDKVTVLSEPDLVVLTIVPPRVIEEVEPELPVEEEVSEPEVIKKGKAEEEESE